ncbi:MAG: fibronectin type III domain-containing protein [Verrucomicrobiae bacterium]|nr:fibronectin type III domain-containing protein [Verrucomicrobiae bacterium]
MNLTLQWDPSTSSNVVGYAVYYGTNSGSYVARVDAGGQTTVSINSLIESTTYYFVAVAYTDYGVESLPSTELAYTVPSPPGGPGSTFRISQLAVTADGVALSWVALPGETYVVVYKESLKDPVWIVASPALLATGTGLQWTDLESAGHRQRFYSVTRRLRPPGEE